MANLIKSFERITNNNKGHWNHPMAFVLFSYWLLFVHKALDTHLRSLLEWLCHDLDKTDLAVCRH